MTLAAAEALDRVAARADAACGRVTPRAMEIGGVSAVLRVADPRLADLVTPAWAASFTDGPTDAAPTLRIDLWAPGPGEGRAPRPELPGRWTWFEVDELASTADGRLVVMDQPFSEIWIDRDGGRVMGWVDPAAPPTRYWRGRPLLWPLVLLLHDHGRTLTHAGLVDLDGTGVLIAGISGSGKTTTSLACLAAGHGFLSDDYCVVDTTTDPPTGHALFASAWLDEAAQRRLPALAVGAVPPSGPDDPLDKSLVLLAERHGHALRRSVPIGLLALPRVTGGTDTVCTPVGPGEALRRLAPSSLLVPFGAGHRGFDQFTRLVRNVPAVDVALGDDLDEVVAALRAAASTMAAA